MAEHHLKVVDPYYAPIKQGLKTFEVRKNDRGFQTGDVVHLHYFEPKYCPGPKCDLTMPEQRRRCPGYLGSSATFEITYVYSGDPRFGGIEPGYVVLGLGEVDE